MQTGRCLALFLLLLSLTGCRDEPPLHALEQAGRLLQQNLEQKNRTAVLAQLHPQFLAQGQQDRQWADQTLRLLFLRHRHIRILVLGHSSQLDPQLSDRGHSSAEVTLTGAEGLLPDSARHYRVQLEWWFEQGRWQLARLRWQ
jgi:hypothetical protein